MDGVPAGVTPLCAAQLFEYDDEKTLNLLEFFRVYKGQFPMLVVIIGGNHGDTIYDCYDNLQVLRINGYSSQPRVIADDPRLNQGDKKDFVTIPEDTPIMFRVVKGHTQLGNRQKFSELLAENNNQFPLLVKMSCDARYRIRIRLNKHVASDFGHILIKEAFVEHFYMMNGIDSVDLKMNKQICMACLSEDLDVAPVTGFKYRSKAEFNEYCRRLTEEVNGADYDMTSGNHELSEYTRGELERLLDVSEFRTGSMLYEDPDADADADYEEVYPRLPSRHPMKGGSTPQTAAQQPSDTNIVAAAKVAKHQKKVTSHTGPTVMSPKSPRTRETDAEIHEKTGFLSKQMHKIKTKAWKRNVERDVKASTQTTTKDSPTDSISQAVPVHDTERSKPNSLKAPPRPLQKPPVDLPHMSVSGTNIPHVPPKTHMPPKTHVPPKTNVPYQNTMIGRATIKPMVEAKVVEDTRVDKSGESCESQYELLSMIPKTKPNGGHVADVEGSAYMGLEECSGICDAMDSGNKAVEEHGIYNKSTPSDDHVAQAKPPHFSVESLSIKEVGERLVELKLAKYVDVLEENQVDGVILSSLSVEDLVNELGLRKLEAVRLHTFVEFGHVPK